MGRTSNKRKVQESSQEQNIEVVKSKTGKASGKRKASEITPDLIKIDGIDQKENQRGRPPTNSKKQKIQLLESLLEQSRLKTPGQVYTFGGGTGGELGFGEDVGELVKPAPLSSLNKVIQVCCGGMHTVAVTESGEVYTWGVNDEGALGRDTGGKLWEAKRNGNAKAKIGTPEDQYIPLTVTFPAGAGKIIQVSAGDSHTCALTDTGDIYGWGTYRDDNGPMAFDLTSKYQLVPKLIIKTDTQTGKFIKISSGTDHVLALTSTGRVYTWGFGGKGQLGRGQALEMLDKRSTEDKLKQYLIPEAIVQFKQPLKHIREVEAGEYSSFIINDIGQVFSCGLNNYGQLGYKVRKYIEPVFKQITQLKEHDIIQIGAGQHHTLVLGSDNEAYSFGRAAYGRLGVEGIDLNSEEPVSDPQYIAKLKNEKIVKVSAGAAVSGCIVDNGDVYLWGLNETCQLGKSEGDEVVPFKLQNSKKYNNIKAIQLEFGGQHVGILGIPRN